MPNMKKSNWRYISRILFIPFILVFLYHHVVLKKDAKQVETKIYSELMKIEPPEMARLQRTEQTHKTSNALVFSDFLIDSSEIELIDYYRQQLAKYGWIFCCNDDNTINTRLVFQKDDYTAHLSIGKKRTGNTKDYRLSVAWRLFDCAECK